MGFLDRLLKKDSADSDSTIQPRKPAKEKPAEFFLDADSSSSLGDVNYMRESKTIRRTFPGTAASPGTKEQIMEVAAETEKLEKRSEGLGGVVKKEESITLNRGHSHTGEENLRYAGEHRGDEQAPQGHRHHGCEYPCSRRCCCLLYTSPSPRDMRRSRMPSSA